MRKTLEISQLTHDRRLALRSRHSEIQTNIYFIIITLIKKIIQAKKKSLVTNKQLNCNKKNHSVERQQQKKNEEFIITNIIANI